MKKYLFLYLWASSLAACSTPGDKVLATPDLLGNYLITDSDLQGDNPDAMHTYAVSKDSIRGLKGLKLISLKKDAVFVQTDSANAFPGSWLFNERRQQLYINNGGSGFTNYSGNIKMENNEFRLTEKMDLGGDSLVIVWHLKKIPEDSPASYLFIPANNAWRIRPVQPEDTVSMRKRIASIFHYYGIYFKLVSIEADYFSPKRVLLPIRYYSHGVGLRTLDDIVPFRTLFYNDADVNKAYEMVHAAMRLDRNYPKGKDFTDEYATYFMQLEKALLKG